MKKFLYISIITLILFSSCENKAFFEFERPSQTPWTLLTDFDRAPIGAYYNLFQRGGYDDAYASWQLYQNAVADDVSWVNTGDSWGWFRDTQYQGKQFLDNVFKFSYVSIASVNDALAYVENNGGNPWPKISNDDKTFNLNRILGELYFIRGFAYYMNATTYCNAYVPGGANDAKQIPLLTSVATDYNDATNPKMGTVAEIWAQVQSDFEKAYTLLPERYIAGKMNVSYQAGRANKFAAAAMLSRTHFALGDYTKASEYASYVIDQNGGDYNLTEDPIQAFNKSTMTRGKEVIFWIPRYDVTTAKQVQIEGAYNHLRIGDINSWSDCCMDSATLIKIGWLNNPKSGYNLTFNAPALSDKRFTQLMIVREPTTSGIPRISGRSYTGDARIKYSTVFANKACRGGAINTNASKYTNTPVLRLAEMYLTRSICRFKAGDKTGAASDLNMVRKRAWDASVGGIYENSASYVTASNITDEMISNERLIEMFCEGDRINYLRGLKTSDIGAGERTPNSVVPYTSSGFVWKLPATETDLNNSLK